MIRYTDEYIERLLDKFLNGVSSVEEEMFLGEYFRTQPVRREWENFREMFAFFDNGMRRDGNEKPVEKRLATAGAKRLFRLAVAASVAVACVLTFIHFGDDDDMVAVMKDAVPAVANTSGRMSENITQPYKKSCSAVACDITMKARAEKEPVRRAAACKSANDGHEQVAGEIDDLEKELRRTDLEIATVENEIAELRGMMIAADAMVYEELAEAGVDAGCPEMDCDELPQIADRIRTFVMP